MGAPRLSPLMFLRKIEIRHFPSFVLYLPTFYFRLILKKKKLCDLGSCEKYSPRPLNLKGFQFPVVRCGKWV